MEPERPIRGDVEPGVVVRGDEDRLRQVIGNLLTNVRVHTPPSTPVDVALAARDGVSELRVSDHGPGVDPEHVEHVFDRFYRADTGRSRDTGGAGLGPVDRGVGGAGARRHDRVLGHGRRRRHVHADTAPRLATGSDSASLQTQPVRIEPARQPSFTRTNERAPRVECPPGEHAGHESSWMCTGRDGLTSLERSLAESSARLFSLRTTTRAIARQWRANAPLDRVRHM